MSSKNSFFFIGNLGDDPEYKPETGPKDKDGNPSGLTTFSVAVDRKDIGSKDVGDWFDIECWGKLAERCAEYLNKGSKVGFMAGLEKTLGRTSNPDPIVPRLYLPQGMFSF